MLQLLGRVRPNDQCALPPVVVFSSSASRRDVDAAYHLGAHSYIRKPDDFEEFGDVVATVVRYRLVLNEAPSRFLGGYSAVSDHPNGASNRAPR